MDTRTPLNIWSQSEEPIGRLLSNFAHTPFSLDGIEYASVEAFYATLLRPGDPLDDDTRGRYGIVAKRRIPKRKPAEFEYFGRVVKTGSDEHHELIKRSIRAKLEAHPEMAREFVATRPRPLVHDTGYRHDPGAEFPHTVFCRILSELREDLAELAWKME